MASMPAERHAGPMVEFILLALTGLACLALFAAVPIEYLEARQEERARRRDR